MVQVPGRFSIYPTQPPVVSGESLVWMPPETLIYNSDEFYPQEFIEVVSEGIMDGARIVTVAVHPLVYRPRSRRLYLVTSVGFDLALGEGVLPDVRPLVRGEYEQLVYDAAFISLVENDYEIAAYYQRPTMMPYSQIGINVPFPTGPAMIITDPAFADAFQPYADWLTDKGIKAQLISPQLIYANFSGVDEAEKIRNYIKYCYQYVGGTWFILGGMDNRFTSPVQPELPSRRCFCVDIIPDTLVAHYDTIPCDHYYCALDSNWNADGDDTWGEMNDGVDQFPEVFVGRILCRDAQEAENWVYKALTYERVPANIASLDTAVWIHQSIWSMGNAMSMFPSYFGHIQITNGTAYDDFNLLDYGYGYTHGQTHGSIKYFPTGYIVGSDEHRIWSYWPDPPSPGNPNAGLNWLTNDDRYFIHYAVSCHTGFYDDYAHLCIAQAFTTEHRNCQTCIPIGACATIEHTRYSLRPSSHTLQEKYYKLLFDAEYPGASSSMIGFALAQAKAHMSWGSSHHRYVSYGTNLFGSPTTPAWTNVPRQFVVSHPTRIPVGEQTQFVVQVEDGEWNNQPVANAKVCLNKPGDVYEIEMTDGNGQATFLILARYEGTLKVTVTRYHNDGIAHTQYLPSQTTCQVLYYPAGGGTQASREVAVAPDRLCITQCQTLLRDNTSFRFGIPEEGEVSIVIYDITGSRVKTISHDLLFPGYYTVKVETTGLAAGVYFVVLKQGADDIVRKCLVIK